MCFGGGGGSPPPAVTPVRANNAPDELSPNIELASEDNLEIAQKKKNKKGTLSMQTDLNIPGSSTIV
jgi:hypothetical protein